jgi:bacterioferritin-associated ferredoxin
MYVCVCKGVTERHIVEAVAEGAASLHDLKSRLGIATCCGRCAECAEVMLDEQVSSSTSTGPLPRRGIPFDRASSCDLPKSSGHPFHDQEQA